MSESSADVFIVGGGPAGLAAAISASKLGLRVTVADGAVPPINKPCGEGLMPDGHAVLRAMGVHLDPGDAHPFLGSRFVDGERTATAHFPETLGVGIGIRRTILHQRMIECAERCGVELRWKASAREITAGGVRLADGFVRGRWIIGADGSHSLVRRWAGLDGSGKASRRFCLRQHFQIAPWAEEVVLYWCGDAQIFVTPVAKDEVGVAIISQAPLQNLDELIARCPALAAKLQDAEPTDTLRGEVTVMRRLPRVYRERIALIGDASGSVDAVTGQGLCLAFLQAQALGRALALDDLCGYERAHTQIMRKPRGMARLLLLMAGHRWVRSRAMLALSSEPALFSRLLGLHVGETAPAEAVSAGLQFGWRFLTA